MTPSDIVRVKQAIEAAWARDLEWDPFFLAGRWSHVDPRYAQQAADQITRGGGEHPPSPAKLFALANALQTADQRSRALPPATEGVTGSEAIRRFAAEHGGYTPAQEAMRVAGIDPGPPRMPEETS